MVDAQFNIFSVPISLPELHRLTLAQVLSVRQDVLQLHFQDASGDEKHNDMHDFTDQMIYFYLKVAAWLDLWNIKRFADCSQKQTMPFQACREIYICLQLLWQGICLQIDSLNDTPWCVY